MNHYTKRDVERLLHLIIKMRKGLFIKCKKKTKKTPRCFGHISTFSAEIIQLKGGFHPLCYLYLTY